MTGNSALQELFDTCGTAELVADGVRLSATALHHGANDWSRALRRAGITRGDRVICALPNGAAFVQLLIAALADGITLAPVPAHEDVVPLLASLDARIAIASEFTEPAHPHVAVPSRAGGPPGAPMTPRAAASRTDTLAFLLRSSGTTAMPRWVAISDRSVVATLRSHLPYLGIDGASTLCILPWHHAFGLVLGLLPALLRARRIVTATEAQRDTDALQAIAAQWGTTHMHMVPLVAARLAATESGKRLLESLDAGLVGGAPIDALLAPQLTTTKLRVGYGQTEAGPGIMLGNPGEFTPAFLGRPIGCEVRLDADGVLAFRGPNACDGYWEAGSLRVLPTDRWHRTNDIATCTAGAYTFVGRTSMTFKLANGKVVDAPQLEASLRTHLPGITDVVLTTRHGREIDIRYSTQDSLPVAREDIARRLGSLRVYLGATQCVGVDAWVRSSKGEIDRRHLPPLT